MKSQLEKLLAQQAKMDRIADPLGMNRYEVALRAADAFTAPYHNAYLDLIENDRVRLLATSGLFGVSSMADSAEAYPDPARWLHPQMDSIGAKAAYGARAYTDVFSSAVTSAIAEYADRFRLPELSELSQLASSATTSFQDSIGVSSVFESMSKMTHPWLHVGHEDASIRGLSGLITMGRSLRESIAYDAVYSESLRNLLGDWPDVDALPDQMQLDPAERTKLYLDRGFNRELTDFTPAAFDEGLRAAGLGSTQDQAAQEELGANPHEDENEKVLIARAANACHEIIRLERAFRRFIERAMTARFGENWETSQVPPGFANRWRQSANVITGSMLRLLIMSISASICRS